MNATDCLLGARAFTHAAHKGLAPYQQRVTCRFSPGRRLLPFVILP